MKGPFELLLAWHGRHTLALGLLAVGVTVASLFFSVDAISWPFWMFAAGFFAAAVRQFGAIEPALIVVGAPLCGHLWTGLCGGGDGPWAPLGLIAGLLVAFVIVAARLARFRGQSAAAIVGGAGALALASALGAAVATWNAAALMPTLAAFLLGTFAMDMLLYKDNTRGTPRLRDVLGGLYACLYLIGAQVFLFVAAQLLRVFPRNRLARVRRLGRACMRLLVRHFPYGGTDWSDITPGAFEKSIVVSNHQSGLDVPVILALPGDIRLTLNRRVWDSPWIGFTARGLGHVLMEPGDPDRVLDGCRAVLRDGASVHFFPEGTRSLEAWPRRFHRGAFEVATTLACNVVPVVLCDTREAVPRNAYWVGNHHISVRVLPAVTPKDFDYGRGSRDLMKHVQKRVRAAFLEELDRLNTPEVLQRKVERYYHYQGRGVEAAVRGALRSDPLLPRLRGELPRTGRVLDLGCGYGVAAHWLTECHPQLDVVGIEGNGDRVRVARRSATGKPRLSFEQAPLTLPQADAAIVRDEAQLAEVAAAVRPGGVLLVRKQDGSYERASA